mgnify:CR=1 FL=1
MGERSPINDTDARGTFIGMRMDTTRTDMLQAVLEGVAFAIKDNIKVYLDESLKRFDFVYPAAGNANSAVKLTLPELELSSKYIAWVDIGKIVEN